MGFQINTNARKKEVESIAFKTFGFEKILNNDSQDPNENFFEAFNFIHSQISSRKLNHFDKNSFSMLLHIKMRNMQKNFDSLCNQLMTLKFKFKVICIIETWCCDNSMSHNLFKLPQYKSIHQVRKTIKGGGIVVFLLESLTFNRDLILKMIS